MKIEINPFPYFIPEHTKTLIVGSFPCFNGHDYGDWYYSGSGRNHFWMLLSAVFDLPAGTQAEKKSLCENHGLALSDVALKVQRLKSNCSDANLRIIEFNVEGLLKCLDANPSKILFTGKFVESTFRKLFPGNAIPTDVLPSPSPAANRHLGGLEEYLSLKSKKKIKDLFEYRLLKYRQLLVN